MMTIVSALVPLVTLGWLVAGQRWPLARAAWTSAAVAVIVALTVARLDLVGLAVAVGKGLWTGAWIACIVVPALLLYRVAATAGAIDHLSDQLGRLAGTRPRQLLLFAWVIPSFVQGVAGFGVPVVVAAPMLVKAGMAPVAAVAAVLVGYYWSVTFGSMGSSFFVAAGTSGIDATTTERFALYTAVALGALAVVSGLLLIRGSGRASRQALGPALITGLAMAGVLVVVARVAPSLASTAAGLAGLIVLMAVFSRRRQEPIDLGTVMVASLPYVGLTVLVMVGAAVVALGMIDASPLVFTPQFPATQSALTTTPAAAAHQPFSVLAHPVGYLLLACAGSWWLYRRIGWLQPGDATEVVGTWAPAARQVAGALGGLTVLAAVMTDAGLSAALASGAATALGTLYAAITPALGALAAAFGGSTTASNALLAPLHASAAHHLEVDVALLLAGQTVGGNIGTVITPLNVVIATAAVGVAGHESAVLRRVTPTAMALLAVVCLLSVVLVLGARAG